MQIIHKADWLYFNIAAFSWFGVKVIPCCHIISYKILNLEHELFNCRSGTSTSSSLIPTKKKFFFWGHLRKSTKNTLWWCTLHWINSHENKNQKKNNSKNSWVSCNLYMRLKRSRDNLNSVRKKQKQNKYEVADDKSRSEEKKRNHYTRNKERKKCFEENSFDCLNLAIHLHKSYKSF